MAASSKVSFVKGSDRDLLNADEAAALKSSGALIIDERRTRTRAFGAVHPAYQTPYVAVGAVAIMTVIGLLLGDSLLVPVTEVGSMASALGWFAACLSFWFVEKRASMRLVTGLGIAVSLLLFLMKIVPAFPGHFSSAEWVACGIWVGLGCVLRVRK